MLYALALPLLGLLWVLSPLAVREGSKARKNILLATYPKVSVWGNNPASQRVHEGGGLRFQWLLIFAPLMVAVGFAMNAFGATVAIPFGQIATLGLAWFVTRRWVDIAEHGAEAMHGDDAMRHGTIDENSRKWMEHYNFASYRDAEAWRMTSAGQEYENMTPDEFKAAMHSRHWASRVILTLAKW